MSQLIAQQDKFLTNASRKLTFEESRYIAQRVLSPIQVKQTTGKIGSYDKEHLRIINTVMGGRGKAPRYETGTKSSNTYAIEKHGLSQVIVEEDADNFEGTPFQAELDAMIDLMHVIWLGREKALADVVHSSTFLTNGETLSGQSQWSDYANSDPLTDFQTARNSLMDNAGVEANKAILPWKVFQKLRYHPQILENLGFAANRAGSIKASEMASVLEVDEILIPSTLNNSADRGQTDTLAQIWGNHASFIFAPKTAKLRTQTLGFDVQRKSPRMVFKNAILNPPGAKEIIVIDSYDQLITDVTCGYLFTDAIA